MSRRWHAGEWIQGELLLSASDTISKVDANALNDVLDEASYDVIVLVTDEPLGGLFAAVSDAEKEKETELKKWAVNKNRNNKYSVWVEADDETLALISSYHKSLGVVNAFIKKDRTFTGEWVKDVGTQIVLRRMFDWLNENK